MQTQQGGASEPIHQQVQSVGPTRPGPKSWAADVVQPGVELGAVVHKSVSRTARHVVLLEHKNLADFRDRASANERAHKQALSAIKGQPVKARENLFS